MSTKNIKKDKNKMLKLADLYDSDDAPSVVSGFLAVGVSTLFCLGMFMILNSHDASQAAQLRQTVAAVKKSQEDGTDIYTALSQLQAKTNSANSKNKNSLSSLDKSLADASSKYSSGANDASVNNLTVTGTGSFNSNLSTNKDLTVKGNAKVSGNITGGGDLSVDGESTLSGDTSVDGDLAISGTTTTDSLEVSSDTSLDGELEVSSAVTFDDDLEVSGTTTLDGDLSVGGDTTIDGALTVGDLQVDTLTTADAAEIGGDFSVAGATSLQGNLDVDGDTTLGGTLDVTGITTLEDTLNGADAVFSGDVSGDTITAGTTLQSNGDTILGLVGAGNILTSGGDLAAYGDVTIGGAFTLADANNPNSKVATGGNVDVTGSIAIHSIHKIDPATGNPYADENTNPAHAPTDGDLDLEGTLSINGSDVKDLFIQNADNFPVGTTTQDASINISGDLQAAAGTFSDTLTANGGLTVTGGGSFDELDVNGQITTTALDVGGSAIFENDVSVDGVFSADSNSVYLGAGDGYNVELNGSIALNGATTTNPSDVNTYGTQISSDVNIDGAVNVSANLVAYALGATNGMLVFGDTSLQNINHITSSNGDNVATRDCGPNKHLLINKVDNGLVTDANGGLCYDDSTNGTGSDYAENYPSNQVLSAGDVVSIDTSNPEYVVKSSGTHERTVIGVVSTAPGFTASTATTGYPIALSGRVPVKVTNENGVIVAGDYLTSSSTPGYAMKANAGDKTIGQALSGFSGTKGTVTMFVSIGIGTTYAQSDDVQNGASPITTGTFSSLNVSGQSTLTDLTVTGSATINDLTVTGTTKVADITVNGHIIGNDDTRGTVTVTAGLKTIHHDFGKPYDSVPTVVASPTSQATLYTVVPTTTGFDINLPTAAAADTSFSYLVEQ